VTQSPPSAKPGTELKWDFNVYVFLFIALFAGIVGILYGALFFLPMLWVGNWTPLFMIGSKAAFWFWYSVYLVVLCCLALKQQRSCAGPVNARRARSGALVCLLLVPLPTSLAGIVLLEFLDGFPGRAAYSTKGDVEFLSLEPSKRRPVASVLHLKLAGHPTTFHYPCVVRRITNKCDLGLLEEFVASDPKSVEITVRKHDNIVRISQGDRRIIELEKEYVAWMSDNTSGLAATFMLAWVFCFGVYVCWRRAERWKRLETSDQLTTDIEIQGASRPPAPQA
jgi:hypothetical protein